MKVYWKARKKYPNKTIHVASCWHVRYSLCICNKERKSKIQWKTKIELCIAVISSRPIQTNLFVHVSNYVKCIFMGEINYATKKRRAQSTSNPILIHALIHIGDACYSVIEFSRPFIVLCQRISSIIKRSWNRANCKIRRAILFTWAKMSAINGFYFQPKSFCVYELNFAKLSMALVREI